MASPDPVIPKRFEVREELYRSEQNVRLRAFDTDLEQEVVLEFPGAGGRQLCASPGERREFLRQARMRAKIRHECIQTLKEVVETPEAVVLVLEPTPGTTLEDELVARGRLTPAEVIDLGLSLAGAAQALHTAGVVHRAIATQNILVDGEGKLAALTGFLFAKPILGVGQSSLAHELCGQDSPEARALPAHPAPEQVAGQVADARSDVFGLGCVLYECLTGRPAFADHAAAWQPPADCAHLVPDLPKELSKALMKCLERSPMSRFQTMLQLRSALEKVPRHTEQERPVDRRKLLAGVAAVLLIGIGGTWAYGAFVGGSSTRQPGNGSGPPGPLGPSRVFPPRYDTSRALLIGIDYEDNDEIDDLKNAEKDVASIGDALTDLGWKVVTLCGKDATTAAIRAAYVALEKESKENDQIFVYFAGHASLQPAPEGLSPRGFIIPHDGKARPVGMTRSMTWLSLDEFCRDFIHLPRGKHVLVALDCCHSGAAFGPLRSVGIKPQTKSGADPGAPYARHYLTSAAKVIMSSCSYNELASDGHGEHSTFARGFLEKLRQARTGPVTHTSIIAHIKDLSVAETYVQLPAAQMIGTARSEFVFMDRK